jgi:hypothetical protein
VTELPEKHFQPWSLKYLLLSKTKQSNQSFPTTSIILTEEKIHFQNCPYSVTFKIGFLPEQGQCQRILFSASQEGYNPSSNIGL